MPSSWFDSVGTLRYSPPLLGERVSANWWIVIDCDPEIGKLYRKLYELASYKCSRIQRPAWDEHITISYNEEPIHKKYWCKYNGATVSFRVFPQDINTDSTYFWLPIYCERAYILREELGLPRLTKVDFHLTFGNNKNVVF